MNTKAAFLRETSWTERAGRRIAPLMLAAAALITGCTQTKGTTASNDVAQDANRNLFSVPADQMQHLHIYSVQPTSLKRVLRLTGTVAFNNFKTTPVISQVSGPVLQ